MLNSSKTLVVNPPDKENDGGAQANRVIREDPQRLNQMLTDLKSLTAEVEVVKTQKQAMKLEVDKLKKKESMWLT